MGRYSLKDIKEDSFHAFGQTVPFEGTKRKCLYCKKTLSMYNLNEYCFAHSHIDGDIKEKNKQLRIKERYEKAKRRKKNK